MHAKTARSTDRASALVASRSKLQTHKEQRRQRSMEPLPGMQDGAWAHKSEPRATQDKELRAVQYPTARFEVFAHWSCRTPSQSPKNPDLPWLVPNHRTHEEKRAMRISNRSENEINNGHPN